MFEQLMEAKTFDIEIGKDIYHCTRRGDSLSITGGLLHENIFIISGKSEVIEFIRKVASIKKVNVGILILSGYKITNIEMLPELRRLMKAKKIIITDQNHKFIVIINEDELLITIENVEEILKIEGKANITSFLLPLTKNDIFTIASLIMANYELEIENWPITSNEISLEVIYFY